MSNHPPTHPVFKHKKAPSKLQASVQNHLKNCESSSEEEELESANLLENLFKNYQNTGGDTKDVARTQTFIQETFLSDASTCLICLSKVKRSDSIWNCTRCYSFFHVTCIQHWSKDTITRQKKDSQQTKLHWCCPKCRNAYNPEDVPLKYLCFCKKTENPKLNRFLVPHSCGETCKKTLPTCEHKCLVLCHPGLCPPCPFVVTVTCYCKAQLPTIQRCSGKDRSCKGPCGKTLECGEHFCTDPCHDGKCWPCTKKSVQKCMCKAQQKLRDCAMPLWQCDKVCNKLLDCNHYCKEVCHAGVCDKCELSRPRRCPCGKTSYQLPRTEDTRTCKDTCDKLLECGIHTCQRGCHKGECGLCLQTVVKACRCGQNSKDVQCGKPYFCESKCKNLKNCNKHPCNRKCCDGSCPPCKEACRQKLNCGNHNCTLICHQGPCYPCSQTDVVSCRCGLTQITLPCRQKNQTIRKTPPKCNQICSLPSDCHHQNRKRHNCHFGLCPPCQEICNETRPTCSHPCSAPCYRHSTVVVLFGLTKQCPKCIIPVSLKCNGGHVDVGLGPCSATRRNCGSPCGRLLKCDNHRCSQLCHQVEAAPDDTKAGTNCEQCTRRCSKERPEGCEHSCPKLCHSGPCPPCNGMLRFKCHCDQCPKKLDCGHRCRTNCHAGRCAPCEKILQIKCHCALNQLEVICKNWPYLKNREQLQSCDKQCPKKFHCGHRCMSNCHSGLCPNADRCQKRIKVTCKCKRGRKKFLCWYVQKNQIIVECDFCQEKDEREDKLQDEVVNEQGKTEEAVLKNEAVVECDACQEKDEVVNDHGKPEEAILKNEGVVECDNCQEKDDGENKLQDKVVNEQGKPEEAVLKNEAVVECDACQEKDEGEDKLQDQVVKEQGKLEEELEEKQ